MSRNNLGPVNRLSYNDTILFQLHKTNQLMATVAANKPLISKQQRPRLEKTVI